MRSGAVLPADENFLDRRVFFVGMAVVVAGYCALFLGYGGASAIDIYNALVFGAAAGAIVAYGIPSWSIVQRLRYSGDEVLTLGIMISWSATFFARAISIVWRLQGKPTDWLDSFVWGLHIPGTLMGSYSHLFGHAAVNGRIPTAAMKRVGIRVMIVMSIVALVVVIGDALDYW